MNKKLAAGEKAVEWVREGMTIGLGTGSTVYYTILKLGVMVNDGLEIKAIATSRSTEKLAHDLGIPLASFSDVERLDLTVDGADAVTPQLDLIKGGGGALLREKLVAKASTTFIIVADDSKKVDSFSGLSIPIEVVPFAWETTKERITNLGGKPVIRHQEGNVFITDNANFILDTVFDNVEDPRELDRALKLTTGVIDTGLFVRMANTVVIGTDEGTTLLQRVK